MIFFFFLCRKTQNNISKPTLDIWLLKNCCKTHPVDICGQPVLFLQNWFEEVLKFRAKPSSEHIEKHRILQHCAVYLLTSCCHSSSSRCSTKLSVGGHWPRPHLPSVSHRQRTPAEPPTTTHTPLQSR